MKTKGRRKSKNVEIAPEDKTDPMGIGHWYGETPNEIKKYEAEVVQDYMSKKSSHLRDKTPVAKQERDVDDLLTSADAVDRIEKNPVKATKTFRELKETHKPQRIQVTPGKWNTKNKK